MPRSPFASPSGGDTPLTPRLQTRMQNRFASRPEKAESACQLIFRTGALTRRPTHPRLMHKQSDPRRRANANRGSNHKESVLLMAKPDPMGGSSAASSSEDVVREACR